MYLTFDIAGDVQLKRQILRWGEHAQAAQPAFRSIMASWMKATTGQFRTSGKRGSGGWAPLAPSTIAQKKRMGGTARTNATKILRRTNRLMFSLTKPGAPYSVQIIKATEMKWGTDLPYAGPHQRGAKATRTQAFGHPTRPYAWSLPRRRPVELTGGARGDRARSVKVLQLWVARGKVA